MVSKYGGFHPIFNTLTYYEVPYGQTKAKETKAQ